MTLRLLLLSIIFLLAGCSRGPGLTPMEQDGLVTLDAAHQARLLFTMDALGAPPAELVPISEEFRKTRLSVHIVWRTVEPPQASHLAQFPGKRFKQFWDPKQLTPSSGGKLLFNQQPVEMELLALRLAFARAAALPE